MSIFKKIKKMQLGLHLFFLISCVTFIVPFLILVGISFSREQDVWHYGYRLIPKNFDLTAYKWVFRNPGQILQAYKVTATFSVVEMILQTFVTTILAYPLSQPEFKMKKVVTMIMFIIMNFSAGLVPTYLWHTQFLHLGNTIWIYIIPNLVNVWNVFMIRTFFKGIPYELSEAAVVDGAGELRIYASIIIPLSKPALATISLMTFLNAWNNWYTSMIYITRDELISLQYFLQRILEDLDLIQTNEQAANMLTYEAIPSETIRMAMAVVVVGPALFVFPFFQKYFVKGMTIGSLKG